MKHNEWRPTYGSSGAGCLSPSIPISKLQTCALVKISPSHKGTIYIIPRSNQGENSIYTLRSVHSRPRRIPQEKTTAHSRVGALAPTMWPHLSVSLSLSLNPDHGWYFIKWSNDKIKSFKLNIVLKLKLKTTSDLRF